MAKSVSRFVKSAVCLVAMACGCIRVASVKEAQDIEIRGFSNVVFSFLPTSGNANQRTREFYLKEIRIVVSGVKSVAGGNKYS